MASERRTDCPSGEELDQAIRSASVTSDLAAHIETCAACQLHLDQLTSPSKLHDIGETLDASVSESFATKTPSNEGSNDLGTIDDLTIQGLIARGGMGEVYRGREDSLKRNVAVKVMRSGLSTRSVERFQRESRAAGKLQHDNIVPIYRTGTTSKGHPFIVFPLIQGGSLRERLSTNPISTNESAQIAFQIASALAAAHAVGLVHRDVKPANILLDVQDGRAKLTDFGLVYAENEETLTQADTICGTPEYMSPEQAGRNQELDGRSDIYSLGVTFYECLTGRVPFHGHPLDVLEQHRSADPVLPSRLNREIPRDLETICLRAMACERDRRYSSAAAFRDDLGRYLAGQPILARPVGGLERGWMWCRRNRSLAASLSLLFFSLAGGLILTSALWFRSATNERAATMLASDLQASRERMRESVQRFQNQIFSSESLHLQMSSPFRAKMFYELIEFLDEFASQEPEGAISGTGNPETVETARELTESYLEIAESGSEAGQWREAEIAIQQALKRSRVRALGLNPSISDWARLSRVARLAAEVQIAKSRNPVVSEVNELFRESIEAADRAFTLDPNSFDGWLLVMRTKLAAIEGECLHGQSARLVTRVQSMFDELYSKPLDEENLVRAAEHGWLRAGAGLMLIVQQPKEKLNEFVDLVDKAAYKYRETLRSQGKTLVASDWLRGEIRLAESQRWKELGDSDAALRAIDAAAENMTEAISRFPQNRRWRMSLASVYSLAADWLLEKPDLVAARSRTNEAIKCLVHILETDAADYRCRLQVIDQLTRYGELSAKLNDADGAWRGYHTAAQDCRMFGSSIGSLRPWTAEMRVWALATGRPWMKKSSYNIPSLSDEEWIEKELTVFESKDFEFNNHKERYRRILAGELQVERPSLPDID